LSLFPFQKIGRYAWLIRPCITRETRASSLVVDSGPCYHPLQGKKFYIFTDGSHTHTGSMGERQGQTKVKRVKGYRL